MRIGIKFKFIFFISSLLLIVISFLSFTILNRIKNYQNNEIETTLFKQKDLFEQYFSEKSNLYDESSGTFQLARGSVFNKPWLRTIPASIYDKNGQLLSGFKTSGKYNENKEKDNMIKYAMNGQVSYVEINDVVYFYSPIKYEDNTIAILELEYSIKENNLFYSNIKNMFLGAGLLSLILGCALGILYFFKFTKDIYKMKSSVKYIQNGEFNKMNSVNRNDELGDLSNGLIFMSNTIEKNIKELKVERDSLSSAVNKLQRMDKQQKEFIGNVTHEFKTPITTIKAYSDVISMYKEDLNLIEEGTSNISRECDRLAALVDKVLNLSALEKYDFEIQKKEVHLKEFFSNICEQMMGKIKKNNLTLNYNIEDITAVIDEQNLQHIIINLIDNAVKYNKPHGEININCCKKDSQINISVSDTGIGIAEEALQKIFEPFYRAESHRSRESGGVGLGLALVKKLVEKQNGMIKVESKLNRGTIFSIELPV